MVLQNGFQVPVLKKIRISNPDVDRIVSEAKHRKSQSNSQISHRNSAYQSTRQLTKSPIKQILQRSLTKSSNEQITSASPTNSSIKAIVASNKIIPAIPLCFANTSLKTNHNEAIPAILSPVTAQATQTIANLPGSDMAEAPDHRPLRFATIWKPEIANEHRAKVNLLENTLRVQNSALAELQADGISAYGMVDDNVVAANKIAELEMQLKDMQVKAASTATVASINEADMKDRINHLENMEIRLRQEMAEQAVNSANKIGQLQDQLKKKRIENGHLKRVVSELEELEFWTWSTENNSRA